MDDLILIEGDGKDVSELLAKLAENGLSVPETTKPKDDNTEHYNSAMVEMAYALTVSPIVLGGSVQGFSHLEDLSDQRVMIKRLHDALNAIDYTSSNDGERVQPERYARFTSKLTEKDITTLASCLNLESKSDGSDLLGFLSADGHYHDVCINHFSSESTDKKLIKRICETFYNSDTEVILSDLYNILDSLSRIGLTSSEYNRMVDSLSLTMSMRFAIHTLCYIMISRTKYKHLAKRMRDLTKTYFYFSLDQDERKIFQYDYGQLILSDPDIAPYKTHNIETYYHIRALSNQFKEKISDFDYLNSPITVTELRNKLVNPKDHKLLHGYITSELKLVHLNQPKAAEIIKLYAECHPMFERLRKELSLVYSEGEHLKSDDMYRMVEQCFLDVVTGIYSLYPKDYNNDYAEEMMIINHVYDDIELNQMPDETQEENVKQISFYHEFFNDCLILLEKSAADYAAIGSDFVNFEHVALLGGQTREMILYLYMAKHFQALGQYVQGAANETREPITGRIQDIVNYCALLAKMIDENKQKARSESAQ